MIAAVLAGGQGRRFGGEKGMALFRGKPMVAWALAAVCGHVSSSVIISNNQELYSGLGVPVFPDRIKGMGPLSGLDSAFHFTGEDYIFLMACDMPLASGLMVEHIIRQAGVFAEDAVIPVAGGLEQGLFAIYRKSAIEKNIERIERGAIQFDEFRSTLKKRLIPEESLRLVEQGLESFSNVNRRDDLRRLEE